MSVRHYIEEKIEDYYKRRRWRLCLNLPCDNVIGDYVGYELENCIDILYNCRSSQEVLTKILANYRLELKNDFIKLHDSGIMPE